MRSHPHPRSLGREQSTLGPHRHPSPSPPLPPPRAQGDKVTLDDPRPWELTGSPTERREVATLGRTRSRDRGAALSPSCLRSAGNAPLSVLTVRRQPGNDPAGPAGSLQDHSQTTLRGVCESERRPRCALPSASTPVQGLQCPQAMRAGAGRVAPEARRSSQGCRTHSLPQDRPWPRAEVHLTQAHASSSEAPHPPAKETLALKGQAAGLDTVISGTGTGQGAGPRGPSMTALGAPQTMQESGQLGSSRAWIWVGQGPGQLGAAGLGWPCTPAPRMRAVIPLCPRSAPSGLCVPSRITAFPPTPTPTSGT